MTNSSTQNKTHIKVIDSPLGSGKTSWSIQYINQLPPEHHVIYITPYLSEVERIISSCENQHFLEPTTKIGRGNKGDALISLVKSGRNIAATHELFRRIDDRVIEALKWNNYILILDEALSVVEKFNLFKDKVYDDIETQSELTAADIKTLLNKEFIKVSPDTYAVNWTDNDNKLNKYDELKRLADRNLLYLVNDTYLLWTFPIEIFKQGVFSEICILTFQFNYQFQALYYDYFGLEYSLYHVTGTYGNYNIVSTVNRDYELEWKSKIKPLINISEHKKLNEIGSVSKNKTKFSLSKNWYDSNPDLVEDIRDNTRNFFQHVTKSKGKERLWTSFKKHSKKIKSDKVSIGNHLSLNARASNEYSHKTTLAYLINRYPDTFFMDFFAKRGIKVDKDGYALSEMLQWIFRSAIRNGQPVNIYIPSERMRTLLEKWLNNEPVKF